MSSYRKGGDAIAFVFLATLLYGLYPRVSPYLGLVAAVLVCLAVLYVVAWLFRRFSPQSRNLKAIDGMTGLEFEQLIAKILRSQGFTAVKLTSKYDYGVDIIAEKDDIRWGIQVKRYSGLVKADAVRQVITALRKYHCTRAMVVSNSYFSNYASELAKSNDCVLVDRNTLTQWL